MMQALDKDLRSALEKTVKAARTVAETAAHAAVDQLGAGHDKPDAFLSDAEKVLRNRLRTHGKQLGDARDSKSTNPTYGKQEVQHLVQEVAYQHWHRMLFARFLADNNLLMYDGVAVTIEECDELAADPDTQPAAKSGWELAGKLAARMLPQVFKPGSPVFELTFAPEHQSELERMLKNLPDAVFKASDSLGWVYQFWQADNKERINKSEVKIGADELPAVTQLFTEPYMVAFLLHNSLGAWWATRHVGKPCPVNLDYFRALEDGTPAAGKFEGWPDSLADFKLLDPCCGSGHFLVAAFLMLVPMRMSAEGLSAKEAVNCVLAENIHGLELDPRCVEIAVFAVALEAWRYPDASGNPLGVREIPAPSIACCGLKVAAKAQDWAVLVPDDAPNSVHLRQGLTQLHEIFSQAPILGSLLDPSKTNSGDLFAADYSVLTDLLSTALSFERQAAIVNDVSDNWDLALSAQGLLEAARILEGRYHLVITNVPYLVRGKQTQILRDFSTSYYEDAKNDLSTVFLCRCIELCIKGGIAQLVLPQNWLTQSSYKQLRKTLLIQERISLIARLGAGAFETIGGEVVKVVLCSIQNTLPSASSLIHDIDVTGYGKAVEKSEKLRTASVVSSAQKEHLSSPGIRILATAMGNAPTLANIATALHGQSAGDNAVFNRCFWEVTDFGDDWRLYQQPPNRTLPFNGREGIVLWERESGSMARLAESVKHLNHKAQQWRSGKPNWRKNGIAVNLVGNIYATYYTGEIYAQSCCVIVPNDESDLPALWKFASSGELAARLRAIDSGVAVTVKTVLAVPFDKGEWEAAELDVKAAEVNPYSEDPTQWIFHGHPQASTDPLQVSIARLLGYVWPAEADDKMELADEALAWIAHSKTLASHADKDGIVCIPPVGRESSASDRLLNLLAAAYGEAWSNGTLAQLLTAADHAGKSLETWLRDKFFIQHCKLFENRPFVWHVWDGLRDGFAALVNYHKLDYKTLEALIYTYLGDWISRQKRDAESGVDGAQEKLAAAEALKKRLELVLVGEAPYDIFVRWKPIEQQPIGWNPDQNDGVRMNIRPFLSVPDVGKRDAGVLRDKPNIKWEKDRGSDVPSAPWYELGLQYGGKVGDRINDHHLTLVEKHAGQEKAK